MYLNAKLVLTGRLVKHTVDMESICPQTAIGQLYIFRLYFVWRISPFLTLIQKMHQSDFNV